MGSWNQVTLQNRINESLIQKVERNKCHICSKTYYIFEPWKKTKAAEAGGYNASSSAELKKKRKKGNTKVERRSRELHPDFFLL